MIGTGGSRIRASYLYIAGGLPVMAAYRTCVWEPQRSIRR
jgi:hypothetical protein